MMLIRKLLWKRKNTVIWSSAMLGITVIQLVGLHQLDDLLKPPDLQTDDVAHAQTKVAAAPVASKKPIDVPGEAIQYVLTPDRNVIAYTTRSSNGKNEELIIKDNSGILLRQDKGKITHMEWLGESNTLLYMLETKKGQEMYLFQLQHKEPHFIYKWENSDRKITKVFFSPYLEFFYVQMRNSNDVELYKYTFSTGLNLLPMKDIKIGRITYDNKQDIIYILDQSGEQWTYQNGAVRDKYGKIYATNVHVPTTREVPATQKELSKEAAKQVQQEARRK
jgi:hypothetical protein